MNRNLNLSALAQRLNHAISPLGATVLLVCAAAAGPVFASPAVKADARATIEARYRAERAACEQIGRAHV